MICLKNFLDSTECSVFKKCFPLIQKSFRREIFSLLQEHIPPSFISYEFKKTHLYCTLFLESSVDSHREQGCLCITTEPSVLRIAHWNQSYTWDELTNERELLSA